MYEQDRESKQDSYLLLGIVVGGTIGLFLGYQITHALLDPICYVKGFKMAIQSLAGICHT